MPSRSSTRRHRAGGGERRRGASGRRTDGRPARERGSPVMTPSGPSAAPPRHSGLRLVRDRDPDARERVVVRGPADPDAAGRADPPGPRHHRHRDEPAAGLLLRALLFDSRLPDRPAGRPAEPEGHHRRGRRALERDDRVRGAGADVRAALPVADRRRCGRGDAQPAGAFPDRRLRAERAAGHRASASTRWGSTSAWRSRSSSAAPWSAWPRGEALWRLPLVGAVRPWQAVFFVVGSARPGHRAAGADDPGAPSPGQAPTPMPVREVLGYFRDNARVVLFHHLGLALIALVNYGYGGWLPTFFVRTHGWTASEAGYLLGVGEPHLRHRGCRAGRPAVGLAAGAGPCRREAPGGRLAPPSASWSATWRSR